MARAFNGSSQYCSVASTLLGNEPIGFFCWGNCNDDTADQAVMGLGDGGAALGTLDMRFSGSTAGDPIRAAKNNDAGTGVVLAVTSTGYTANAWHAAAVAFRSDTSRDAYIDGGGKGSNTTSRTDPTPNFISIGALRRSSVALYFNGEVAEAFVFDYGPTDAEQALLAKGIHPIDACIPIANIRAWYPLMGDDNNRIGGGYPDLTPTGSPTFASHPPKPIYPRIGGLICL